MCYRLLSILKKVIRMERVLRKISLNGWHRAGKGGALDVAYLYRLDEDDAASRRYLLVVTAGPDTPGSS